MEKINHALRQKCSSDLDKPIRIVIVGLLTAKVINELNLTQIEGLDQLYKGKLTGRQILNLEKMDEIKSIELDANMHML